MEDVEKAEHQMHRVLGPWHLTLLGIGGVIGAGIFVLTGQAAANYAGPGIALPNGGNLIVQYGFPSITETINTTTPGQFLVSKRATVTLSCKSLGQVYFIVVDGVPVTSSAAFSTGSFDGLLTGITAGTFAAGSHTVAVAGMCYVPGDFNLGGHSTFGFSTSSVVIIP